MADDKRLELRVSAEWLAAVDGARGVVPRATFVKESVSWLVEQGLELPGTPKGTDVSGPSEAPGPGQALNSLPRAQRVVEHHTGGEAFKAMQERQRRLNKPKGL